MGVFAAVVYLVNRTSSLFHVSFKLWQNFNIDFLTGPCIFLALNFFYLVLLKNENNSLGIT